MITMQKLKLRNYINIAFILIWMFTIFNFSNQNGQASSGLSNKVIIKLVEIIKNKTISNEEKEYFISKYKFIVRKAAHFSAYFILGILTTILLVDLNGATKKIFIYLLFFNFLYACTDELHQRFISGRNGNFIDVLIDTSGALFAIIIIYIFNFVKKRHLTTKQ